jgi:hypothetical protein
MTDWKKVELGNSWDYKAAKKGDEVIGVFLNKEENVGENNSNVYNLESATGELISVWGSTVLDIRLKNVKLGEEVKIVYLGQLESEKRKGKFYHNFDVYHRELPMEKVEDVDPDDIPADLK